MTQQAPVAPAPGSQDPSAHHALVRSVARAKAKEPGALLPILHEVQHRCGYVPEGSEMIIAQELNLSRAEVHGVISFYKDFTRTPPARVAVRVCRAEACQAVGAGTLVRHMVERLGIEPGQSTADQAVSLDQVFCFGNCALGPTVEVAGRLYGRMDPDRFDEALGSAIRAVTAAPERS